MVTPAVPLHIHALLSLVLSSFSSFLIAVLLHYQIHTLHLDPSSSVLLSAFAFLCEAFVGVTPSVALLRHFFSLELVYEEQCSGCASLRTADASVPGALDAGSSPKQRGSGGSGCRLSNGDKGGGSVLPAPEIVEHMVVSSLAPNGVQPPESLTRLRVALWGLLHTTADALRHLGAGLASNEVRLEDERWYLASGWRQLEVAVKLGRLQRERARAEVEGTLATAAKAREHALSEAQEAECRGMASENRHRELCTLNADFEEQAQLRATLGEVQQILEQERLETRERQVSLAEESLASREAKLQEDIDRGVVEAQRSLLLDYRAKLRLQESRFRECQGHLKNEVDALWKRLDLEVKRR
ncbi:hypothetical protein D1007_51411 [Hordeum vulgare]|nr:hypothetical protein D1007_51411 [Hordeum vulgare]